jgi:hypothetical protein
MVVKRFGGSEFEFFGCQRSRIIGLFVRALAVCRSWSGMLCFLVNVEKIRLSPNLNTNPMKIALFSTSSIRKLRGAFALSLSALLIGVTNHPQPAGAEDIWSAPPDLTHPSREVLPSDFLLPSGPLLPFQAGPLPSGAAPSIYVVDPIINNTTFNFAASDSTGGTEPSIAINPGNPSQIVMTSFSGGWTPAPLWFSVNGGASWTKEFTIPIPPADPGGGPNDQTVDFGRNNILYGTFLSCFSTNGCNVYSGQSVNPASAAGWSWFQVNGAAQTSNTNDAASNFGTDQPWLLVNRDPTTPGQDNVYVAYDNGYNMRVAVSRGANPPNFTVDNQSGTAAGGVNPGHRLAADPRTGWMYSLFQRNTAGISIDYMLNRTVNAGTTWTLNGAAGGIIVATASSDQLNTVKFGTVNDLRGGVLHAAVDPSNGDVYYVYGNRDSVTTNNRLAIRRITFNNVTTNAIIGPEVFITGQVQAAMPSVAVSSDGTVGVLYDTFDGFTSDGFPIFTAHFSASIDNATTFTDYPLETFVSPVKDSCTNAPVNCGDKQRILGDYQQLKSVGRSFYGVFSGNRAPFGGTRSIIDPIFFRASFGPQIQVPGNVAFSDTCVGSTNFTTLYVCNTGTEDLQVGPISSSNPQFSVVTPSSGYPVIISPDFCFPFRVQFAPTSAGDKTATFTIPSNDPVTPTNTVLASGKAVGPSITAFIADSGSFGDVCLGNFKDLNLTINNSGGCTLIISNITSSSGQFLVPLVLNYPIVIQPGDSAAVPIRFQPTSLGAKTGTIIIASNDPNSPNRLVSVTGNVPPGDIRVTGSTDFGDVCAGTLAEKAIAICNVGKCDLSVTNVAFVPNCPDFVLVNNPFPAVISHDSCVSVTIRYTPTSCGPKTCNLRIITDDPDMPVINITVTANTPCPAIDVPPDLGFPPEVIQSAGACSTPLPFPISNLGNCNLFITNVVIGGLNAGDYSISALPSFPIILEPGHIVGEGDMNIVFAPTAIDRARKATISVTYISDPISGAATTVARLLCGEGVYTGARVLVMHGGVPLAQVEKIHLQRINANRNKPILDTTDVAMNLPLVTVVPTAPCGPFQYHREYGTVSNPIQLLPGSYQVTATAIINGKHKSLSVGFDVSTCDFNPTIVINF